MTLLTIPFLLQFTGYEVLRIWAIWGGIFLILQSVLSAVLLNNDFKTLPRGRHQLVDVRGGIPGINGEQMISTDEMGFRVTKQIDYRSDASYRIFAIGGSTTEQIYIDDKNTWTHIIENALTRKLNQNVEVINTGVSGLRARHHLATLQTILPLHPDMVVFLTGINDWNHYIEEYISKRKPVSAFEYYRSKLFLRESMIVTAIPKIYSLLRHVSEETMPSVRVEYGEYYTKQRDSLSRSNAYAFHPHDVQQEYKSYLLKISDMCHVNNITCVFITQPTGYQITASNEYKKSFWMTPPNQPYTLNFESMVEVAGLYNKYIMKFSIEHKHPLCDAAPEFSASFDNFYDDCHFNTQGANKMGEVVSQCLESVIVSNK